MRTSRTMETGMRKTAIFLGLALLAGGAWAEPQPRRASSTGKPPVKAASAKPLASPAAQRGAVPAAAATEAPLGQEELSIAERVHQGRLPCEMGATVRVEPDLSQPGYFNVHGKGFRYRMHPVATRTGAIRLEDKQAGAVWLQLANKSMLMDQKKGRRVADECAHPDQMAFAADMKNNPPPKLFETSGMGRDD